MPTVTDKARIRALLHADPVWGVYALGDLAPAMFPKTRWFVPDLTLVLKEYGTSILFAMGTRSICEALDHVTWPVHLQLRDEGFAEATRHVAIGKTQRMWRMGWTGETPAAAARPGPPAVTRLRAEDVPALERLYADGEAAGESPEFFMRSMVTDYVFMGVYEGADLVAVAGTHLVSREESAAAIGNVYTRRDRRGRGLARIVTRAVLEALAGVETIGLNVRADNDVAVGLYESLGFVRHCLFNEALATGLRTA